MYVRARMCVYVRVCALYVLVCACTCLSLREEEEQLRIVRFIVALFGVRVRAAAHIVNTTREVLPTVGCPYGLND